jgi:hypothetical protein
MIDLHHQRQQGVPVIDQTLSHDLGLNSEQHENNSDEHNDGHDSDADIIDSQWQSLATNATVSLADKSLVPSAISASDDDDDDDGSDNDEE